MHPSLGSGYNNLCLVYEQKHDYNMAQEYARKGLGVKRMMVAHNSNTLVLSLINMARMTFKYNGSTRRSLSLLDEAYGIRAEMGVVHHLTADVHMHRGAMQLHLEQFERAANSFANAVRIFEQEKGLRQRQMAKAWHNWGVALKNLGRLEEAEHRLSKSIRVTEKVAKDNDLRSEDEENLRDALRELRDVKSRIELRY